MNTLVAETVAERPIVEWCGRLESERVPFAPVLDYAEAILDPQVLHRDQILELQHPTSSDLRVVGPPWIMTGAQAVPSPPPVLGQHTGEVLRDWLGFEESDFEAATVSAKAGTATGDA